MGMTSLPKHIKYKSWAGILIKGETKWEPSTVKPENHLEKATWLTSAVEGGAMFGTVQSYDGAGISAGLEHTIAVLPKSMEQGDLWRVLMKMDEGLPDTHKSWVSMKSMFDSVGWYLDLKGVLRKKATGTIVPAAEIRNEVAPINGVVSESGPSFDKAVTWAKVFNELFEDPATFQIQIRITKNNLLASHKDLESRVYKRFGGLENASAAVVGVNLKPEIDLAMGFYHSFSVNAPTKAKAVLAQTLDVPGLGSVDFSKALIRNLGTATYGKWKERYTRTRTLAKTSGLYSQDLFNSIAPVTL